jgi:hypothetical protein
MRYMCHGGWSLRRCVERGSNARPTAVGFDRPAVVSPRLRSTRHRARFGNRAASPSITTSALRIDTAIEQRGSRATLRHFRVPVPVWNQNVPSSHMAPTAVTCGLPSSLTVDSQVVREFTASGAGADPAASCSTTAAQSTGGSPSDSPRLMISTRHPLCPADTGVRSALASHSCGRRCLPLTPVCCCWRLIGSAVEWARFPGRTRSRHCTEYGQKRADRRTGHRGS